MKIVSVTTSMMLLAALLSGCSGNDQPEKQHATSHSNHSSMQMEADEPTDFSIYNVNSTWQNRHGNTVKLESLKGKIQVVAMLYTHCEYACPRILADMRRIKDGLSDEALSATNFTIISIDPERDTPERLRTFAEENNLSKEHWSLLRGSNGDILEMAALLGVKYKRVSDTDYTHSTMLTVLNREGEVVHQQMKLGNQLKQTVEMIEKLAE